jgi:hypothetical protein
MQKGFADFAGRFGHENTGGGLPPHQNRQSANVILMRVRNEDGIEQSVSDRLEIGQGFVPFVLRMHPAIDHDPVIAGFEIIRVRANLSLSR